MVLHPRQLPIAASEHTRRSTIDNRICDISQWVNIASQLGDAETAAVALVAMTSDAYVVTQDARRYATDLLDGPNVIELAE